MSKNSPSQKGRKSRGKISSGHLVTLGKGVDDQFFKAFKGTPNHGLNRKLDQTGKNKLWGSSLFKLHEFSYKPVEERRKLILDCQKNGEFRCFWCGRVFFRGVLGPNTNIQIKCHNSKCRHMNVISSV